MTNSNLHDSWRSGAISVLLRMLRFTFKIYGEKIGYLCWMNITLHFWDGISHAKVSMKSAVADRYVGWLCLIRRGMKCFNVSFYRKKAIFWKRSSSWFLIFKIVKCIQCRKSSTGIICKKLVKRKGLNANVLKQIMRLMVGYWKYTTLALRM